VDVGTRGVALADVGPIGVAHSNVRANIALVNVRSETALAEVAQANVALAALADKTLAIASAVDWDGRGDGGRSRCRCGRCCARRSYRLGRFIARATESSVGPSKLNWIPHFGDRVAVRGSIKCAPRAGRYDCKRAASQHVLARRCDPLPDIAKHVIQAPCVRQLMRNFVGLSATVAAGPGDFLASAVAAPDRAGTRGVLPFVFGRQAHTDVPAKVKRLLVRYALYREL
jgi:hypothetical protein